MSDQYQMVIITLDDGTVISYTGKAQVSPGESRRVRDIKFTEPRELPQDCKFEALEATGEQG